MKVAFSRLCDEDLEYIADVIARDSPRRARSYVREIRDCCRSLARMPNRFPAATEFGSGLRRRFFGAYLILFSVHADHVLVERILHTARDLGPDDLLKS